MERLTDQVNGVTVYRGTGNKYDTGMIPAELESGQVRIVMEKLFAYEDTGLTPEEIIGLCSMDRRARMAEILRSEEKQEEEKSREKILKDAVLTWGRNAQSLMMIEEMSELTKVICKFYRAGDDMSAGEAVESIREEMADVQIMLDQMRIMFGETGHQERLKLERLGRRLDKAHAAAGGERQ